MPAKSTKALSPRTSRKKKVVEEVPSFKVTTHLLIPKHELLVRAEADEILKNYHASPGQFPYLLSTDPVAKEIGAKPGDLVRVTRSSDTAGQSVYYRYVVEG